MASSSPMTAISITSAVTSTATSATSSVASSGPAATYNGFPSKDLFFFVVVGIPVIAITAISVFLGCCCCCKFSWRTAHRNRRERQMQALETAAAQKNASSTTSDMITTPPELVAPEGAYYPELAGNAQEPPPKYDSAVKQSGQRDTNEPQLKYNFSADRQV